MVSRVNIMCLAKRACLASGFAHCPLTHRYGNSVSTVRAALEVKQVFEQLAEADKGGVTPEQKQKLEEQATEKVCVSNTMGRWLYCLSDFACLGGMIKALTESETFHATRRAVSRASKRYLRLVHTLPNNVLLACSWNE